MATDKKKDNNKEFSLKKKWSNFRSYFAYGVKNKKISVVQLVVDTALIVTGIFGLISTIREKPFISAVLLLTVFGLIWQIYSSFAGLFKYCKNDIHDESSDDSFDYSVIAEEGWTVEHCKNGCISYSSDINNMLIRSDPAFIVDEKAAEKVDRYILTRFEMLSPFLAKHYHDANVNKKMFTNDEKLCFPGAVTANAPLAIAKGCYYNTFLTNKIFVRKLYLNDALPLEPPIGIRSTEHFSHGCCEYFSNEIGVSTVAVTNDGYLFYQGQGTHSESSAGLIVPSGSGSADWEDYADHSSEFKTFKQIIDFSTLRELAEETSTDRIKGEPRRSRNRVIGFFRWLNSGGKPEFISLSRIDADKCEIKPQRCEQQEFLSDRFAFRIVVPDNNDKKTIDEAALYKAFEVMHKNECSVPLYAAIVFLKEYYENHKEEFTEFVCG